jgi:hypothetical protein
VGETTKAVATVTDVNGNPVPNASVTLKVTGANARTLTGTTDASGQATFTYTGSKAGTDTLVATSGSAQSNSATVLWTAAPTATPSPPILAQTGTTPESPLAFGKAFAGWLLLILGMVLFLARRRARS